MLSISIWTPDEVYACAEYIRSNPDEKPILRICGTPAKL